MWVLGLPGPRPAPPAPLFLPPNKSFSHHLFWLMSSLRFADLDVGGGEWEALRNELTFQAQLNFRLKKKN